MMHLHIVTPDGIIYKDDVDSVSLPTSTGQITILPNHISLISTIMAGEIEIKKNNSIIYLAISTGIVEIRSKNNVYIMADSAERAEHIDLERAEAARQRAVQLLAEQKHLEDTDFARIQASIEKELARIKVGRKYKNLN